MQSRFRISAALVRRGLIEAHRDYAVQTIHRPISAIFCCSLIEAAYGSTAATCLNSSTNIEHSILQQRRQHVANELERGMHSGVVGGE